MKIHIYFKLFDVVMIFLCLPPYVGHFVKKNDLFALCIFFIVITLCHFIPILTTTTSLNKFGNLLRKSWKNSVLKRFISEDIAHFWHKFLWLTWSSKYIFLTQLICSILVCFIGYWNLHLSFHYYRHSRKFRHRKSRRLVKVGTHFYLYINI